MFYAASSAEAFAPTWDAPFWVQKNPPDAYGMGKITAVDPALHPDWNPIFCLIGLIKNDSLKFGLSMDQCNPTINRDEDLPISFWGNFPSNVTH